MAYSDCLGINLKKPGQVLGFVLYASVALGGAWLLIHFMSDNHEWVKVAKIEKDGRVAFAVGYLAYLAALWSARTAVINMVRQHTVNTLLQSRLSDVFIARGEAVAKGLDAHAAAGSSEPPHVFHVAIDDLKYLLNFYEYVAVGIRYGDLDEEVMYNTLRSVVMNMCQHFEVYIDEEQAKNPRYFCNLIDLRNKWALQKANEETLAARSLRSGLPAHEANRLK